MMEDDSVKVGLWKHGKTISYLNAALSQASGVSTAGRFSVVRSMLSKSSLTDVGCIFNWFSNNEHTSLLTLGWLSEQKYCSNWFSADGSDCCCAFLPLNLRTIVNPLSPERNWLKLMKSSGVWSGVSTSTGFWFNSLAIWPFFDWASVWTLVLLDVDSVLKSLNAIESVLFNMFSGVLATVTRSEKKRIRLVMKIDLAEAFLIL